MSNIKLAVELSYSDFKGSYVLAEDYKKNIQVLKDDGNNPSLVNFETFMFDYLNVNITDESLYKDDGISLLKIKTSIMNLNPEEANNVAMTFINNDFSQDIRADLDNSPTLSDGKPNKFYHKNCIYFHMANELSVFFNELLDTNLSKYNDGYLVEKVKFYYCENESSQEDIIEAYMDRLEQINLSSEKASENEMVKFRKAYENDEKFRKQMATAALNNFSKKMGGKIENFSLKDFLDMPANESLTEEKFKQIKDEVILPIIRTLDIHNKNLDSSLDPA